MLYGRKADVPGEARLVDADGPSTLPLLHSRLQPETGLQHVMRARSPKSGGWFGVGDASVSSLSSMHMLRGEISAIDEIQLFNSKNCQLDGAPDNNSLENTVNLKTDPLHELK